MCGAWLACVSGGPRCGPWAAVLEPSTCRIAGPHAVTRVCAKCHIPGKCSMCTGWWNKDWTRPIVWPPHVCAKCPACGGRRGTLYLPADSSQPWGKVPCFLFWRHFVKARTHKEKQSTQLEKDLKTQTGIFTKKTEDLQARVDDSPRQPVK